MSERAATPLELIRLTSDYFTKKGLPSPRVDAEILLAHTLGVKRLDLYLRFDQPLADEEIARFRELVRKRGLGTPVQHLTGEQEFYAIRLQVSPRVLVPRPETEGLVEAIFAQVAPEGAYLPLQVADVGTGSGAIAIALATGWPKAQVLAIDLSPEALLVARANIAALGLEGRVRALHGDALDALPETPARFDLIVSNPPYIPSGEIDGLPVDVRDHEPRLALDGGTDGLDILRRLIRRAPTKLVAGGWLFLEIGESQGEVVCELMRAAGFDAVALRRDLAGRPRVVSGRLPVAAS